MVSAVTTLAVTVCSGAAAVIAVRAVIKTVKRGEWTSTAYLSLGLAFTTFSFVNLLVTYTDSWVTVTDVFLNTNHEVPPWAQNVLRVALLVQGFTAVALVVVRVRRRKTDINVPAAFLLIVGLMSGRLGISVRRPSDAAVHSDPICFR